MKIHELVTKFDESDQASFIDLFIAAGIIDNDPQTELQSHRYMIIDFSIDCTHPVYKMADCPLKQLHKPVECKKCEWGK